MAEKPRNFAAMREDRVRAMAAQRFGRAFGSKTEAMDALATLPIAEQHSLKKPDTVRSRTAPAARVNAPDHLVRGGIAPPSSGKLAAARPDVVQRYARASTGIAARSKAQALTLLAKYGATDVKAAAGAALQQSGLRATDAPTKPELRAAIRQAGGRTSRNSRITKGALKATLAALTSGGVKGLAVAAGAAAIASLTTATTQARESSMADKKQQPSRGLTKRELEAAKADSAAKTAEAQAEAAKADASARAAESQARVEQMRVENERAANAQSQETARAKLAAETTAAKLKAEREARAANLNLAGTVGGAAVGVGVGKLVASKMQKADTDAERLRAAESANLAKAAKGGPGSVKAKAVAKAAQDLKLVSAPTRTGRAMRAAGKLGLPYAIGLGVEAVASRYVAMQMAENGNAEGAAAANALSMVGGAGAVSLVGQRATDMVSPSVLPDAQSIAKIEEARIKADMPKPASPAKAKLKPRAKAVPAPTGAAATLDDAVKAAMDATKNMEKAIKAAGKAASSAKVLLPAVAVAAAASAAAGGASAAEVAKVGADVLTSGAVSTYDEAKKRGASTTAAAAEGAFKGAVNTATFGVVDMANERAKEKGFSGGVAEVLATAYDAVVERLSGEKAGARASLTGKPDPVGDVLNAAGGAVVAAGGATLLSDAGKAASLAKRVALRTAGGTMIAVGAGVAATALAGKANAAEADGTGNTKIGFQNESTQEAAQAGRAEQAKATGGDGSNVAAAGVAAVGLGIGTGMLQEALAKPSLFDNPSKAVRAAKGAGGLALLAAGGAAALYSLTHTAKAGEAGPARADAGSLENTAWRNMQARLKASGDTDYARYEADAQAIENGAPNADALAASVAARTAQYKRLAMTPGQLGKPGPELLPKAYLNDAAKAKAEKAPVKPVIAPTTTRAANPSQPVSDGSTEGYTRRGKNGTVVQVKSYRTPKK
jgi:hypothetical protein